MRIATWNVNSIRSRVTGVVGWLKNNPCDIVLLQELKCIEAAFPHDAFEELNYNIALHGQLTYNGVAVLSKTPVQTLCRGVPGYQDAAARYIECFTQGTTVACVYVPNGGEVNSDKYLYKLDFLKQLQQHLKQRLLEESHFVLGGDFNVALNDDDVFSPAAMHEQICFTTQERSALRSLLALGFFDSFRLSTKAPGFTWWDYRGGAFFKNRGMRLDYILLSPRMIRNLKETRTDKEPRSLEKPSDHIPVVCELEDIN